MEAFILSHKLISWNAVEKLIGAPTGTIRIDGSRRIPEKYKQAIIDIISKYGYVEDDVDDVPQAPVQAIADNNDDMYEFTYSRDMIRYATTKDDGLAKSIKPYGVHIYIKKKDIEPLEDYKEAFKV